MGCGPRSPSHRRRRARRGGRPASARRLADMRLDQHDAHALAVLQLAQRVDALLAAADAPRGLLGHLDLGDQVAGRGSHPGSRSRPACGSGCDRRRTRRGTSPAATAVSQLDVDAGVVLRKARHLASAIELHRQLADPVGQDALDVLLPEREPVVVAGREVADVETNVEKPATCMICPARESARRSRADRAPRWCASAGRPRASRRAPGSSRRSTMATSTFASASSAANISPVGPPPAITTACLVMVATVRHDPGLAASPRVWHKLEVEADGGRAPRRPRGVETGRVLRHQTCRARLATSSGARRARGRCAKRSDVLAASSQLRRVGRVRPRGSPRLRLPPAEAQPHRCDVERHQAGLAARCRASTRSARRRAGRARAAPRGHQQGARGNRRRWPWRGDGACASRDRLDRRREAVVLREVLEHHAGLGDDEPPWTSSGIRPLRE